MKSLSNASDQREILNRLGAIGPASQRRWGKMTVAEMVCHLSDALREHGRQADEADQRLVFAFCVQAGGVVVSVEVAARGSNGP